MAIQKRKSLVAATIILILTAVAIFCFLLTQANFVAWALKDILNRSSSLKVQSLTLTKINWVSAFDLNLKDLQLTIEFNNSLHQVSIPNLKIQHLDGVYTQTPVLISTQGISIVSEQIHVSNMDVSSNLLFSDFDYKISTNIFKVDVINYGPYKLTALKGIILDNKNLINLKILEGQFYGGHLSSVGWLKYKNSFLFDIKTHMDLIDSMLLSEVNQSFSQFSAKVNGDVRFFNLNNNGLSVEGNLYAPQGGAMKASLLRFMAQYIPQKDQINDLVKKDQRVLFDKARLIINMISAQKLSSQVNLSSSSLNLNMNVKFDINVEDGFQYLLNLAH